VLIVSPLRVVDSPIYVITYTKHSYLAATSDSEPKYADDIILLCLI
jgi:hypothetical protein